MFRATKMILNYEELLDDIQLNRYKTLKQTLSRYKHLFYEKNVLDYGASSGLIFSCDDGTRGQHQLQA